MSNPFPLQVWLIQHIPTGKYLPAKLFRSGSRGLTFWRPWDATQISYDPTPRLFRTSDQASKFRAQYLRGTPEWQDIGRGDIFGPDQKLVFVKTPHHVAGDFFIIEGTLYV